MKLAKKKIRVTAAALLALSRERDGTVSRERVRAILQELPKTFPAMTLRPLLKMFYSDVARELRFSEARIEFAGTLAAEAQNELAEHFSKIYNRAIVPVPVKNDDLLAGIRVQVGDDIYDASVANQLSKLQYSLNVPA